MGRINAYNNTVMKIPQQLLDSMEAKNLDHVYQHLDSLEKELKDLNKKQDYNKEVLLVIGEGIAKIKTATYQQANTTKRLTKIVLVGLILLIFKTITYEYGEILQTMWEAGRDTLQLWF